MSIKAGISFCCLVAMFSACAVFRPPAADEHKTRETAPMLITPATAAVRQKSFFSGRNEQKEETLFYQGLRLLFDPTQGDPLAARGRLEYLIKAYPAGKWQEAAAGVLNLMKERDDCRRRLAAEEENIARVTAERDKARQDNEPQQQELRLLNEKCQADMAVWQQENEQLKKDLELLKKLEIQLNTREKERR